MKTIDPKSRENKHQKMEIPDPTIGSYRKDINTESPFYKSSSKRQKHSSMTFSEPSDVNNGGCSTIHEN